MIDATTPRQATTPAGHVVNRRLRVTDDHLAAVLAGTATLLFDGAMGTQLQAAGLAVGDLPELLNLTDPAAVTRIHAAYVAAGAEAITTNTFGANASKLGQAASVADVVAAGVACARAASARYVAADIGPIGALLAPMGTLSFDAAYDLFAEQAVVATAAGADLFVIETMADLAEAKAALLAVRENSDLPAFVTMTFDADGRTFLGTTPEIAAVTLSALGADALGINCSLGPSDVTPLVARMLPYARCPVMAQANAGLPQVVDGATTYTVTPAAYCAAVAEMVDAGVTIVGGCCGTTPEFTAGESAMLAARAGTTDSNTNTNEGVVTSDARNIGLTTTLSGKVLAHSDISNPQSVSKCPNSRVVPTNDSASRHIDTFTVASAQQLVELHVGDVGVIGERINPTGKRKLKEALRGGSHDYVMSEAVAQDRAGAQILDVNAGLPEIDERACMLRLVSELAGVTTLPLQIDSADPTVVEAAVRGYAGKPIINSCNGTAESLATMLPIARHYGCAIVGLTLDEGGIPATAEGRLAIARRIVGAAEELGIPRCDIAIDCLTMAASTDQTAPGQILEAIRRVKRELAGVRTVLGVSNISFGLPARPLVNATFLAAAFAAGLDLAIINPLSAELADVVATWRVLSGEDAAAQGYVAGYEGWERRASMASRLSPPTSSDGPRLASLAAELQAKGEQGDAPGTGGAAASSEENHIGELVVAGRRDAVAAAVSKLLEGGGGEGRAGNSTAPDDDADALVMHVINDVLIPALDEVGGRFEAGTFFLPQLMASAEAAKAGFDVLRELGGGAATTATKGAIVLATVKGDIHDIGKNIVRMLLENYGYDVIDLGRDVDPQVVVDAVVDRHVCLCGLSALMTTTVPAMAETIELLREQAPWCKVVVGGAVLNPEYAEMVGADYYAKDAAATAHIAAEVLG